MYVKYHFFMQKQNAYQTEYHYLFNKKKMQLTNSSLSVERAA